MVSLPAVLCAPWDKPTTELHNFNSYAELFSFLKTNKIEMPHLFLFAMRLLGDFLSLRIVFTAKDKPVIQEIMDNAFTGDMYAHLPFEAMWHYLPLDLSPSLCLPLIDKFDELRLAKKNTFVLTMHVAPLEQVIRYIATPLNELGPK